MRGRNWEGTAAGVVIGLGVGVALGMLLAPKSGQETRDQIAGTVQDGLDSALAAGQDIASRAQNTLDEARERVKEATAAGEQAYRKAKSNVA
jgi:gas vesicle protein